MTSRDRASAGVRARRSVPRRVLRGLERRAASFRGASLAVLAVALVSYSLAVIGFSQAGGPHLDWPDRLYRSLQVYSLGLGDLDPSVTNIYLELARFLGVVVTALSVALAFAFVLARRLGLWSAREDHVVVCGLGHKSLYVTRSALAAGARVVVVELEADGDLVSACKEAGAQIVTGDARDPDVLALARVADAKTLIAVAGSDGANAEIVARASELASKADRDSDLLCVAHITDPELCAALRAHELLHGSGRGFRYEFFNVFERGAHLVLDDASHTPGGTMVIVGLTDFGRAITLEVARAYERGERSISRLVITDPEASARMERLTAHYPDLARGLHITPVDISPRDAGFANGVVPSLAAATVGIVIVCLDDESESILAALRTLRWVPVDATVVVRTYTRGGLSAVLERQRTSATAELVAFPLLEETCSLEAVEAGSIEILARAVYEDGYLAHAADSGVTPRRWPDLPPSLQASNRAHASDIGSALHEFGLALAPLSSIAGQLLPFSDAELESLAQREHVRWVNERTTAGWTPGADVDPGKKTTPYLVPWDELSDEIKDIDRGIVRRWPAILARAGLEIIRVPGRGSGQDITV